jgi:hypothetical protein
MYRAVAERDLPRFADRAWPLLERQAVDHNVLLTLLAEAQAEPSPDTSSGVVGRQYLTLEDGEAVVGVAWQPHCPACGAGSAQA